MLAISGLDLGWLHLAGYCVLGAGGAFVYVPSLQLCRILPKLSSLMMAFLTSAFDMSAIIFVVLDWVYLGLGKSVSAGWIMAGYILVPLIAFILVTSFYPGGDIPISTRQSGTGQNAWTPLSTHKRDEIKGGPRHILEILSSIDFYMVTIFTGIVISRFVVFVATLNLSLSSLGIDWPYQRILLTGFQTFFPLGGFISMTAVGQLLQSFSLGTNTLLFWAVIVFIWEPLKLSPRNEMQAASLLICALIRPYFYSITNQLFERMFGNRNGWVYGLAIMIAALFNLPSLHLLLVGAEARYPILASIYRCIKFSLNLGFIFPFYLYYRRL